MQIVDFGTYSLVTDALLLAVCHGMLSCIYQEKDKKARRTDRRVCFVK